MNTPLSTSICNAGAVLPGAFAGGQAGRDGKDHAGAGDQYDDQAGHEKIQAEPGIQTPCTNGR